MGRGLGKGLSALFGDSEQEYDLSMSRGDKEITPKVSSSAVSVDNLSNKTVESNANPIVDNQSNKKVESNSSPIIDNMSDKVVVASASTIIDDSVILPPSTQATTDGIIPNEPTAFVEKTTASLINNPLIESDSENIAIELPLNRIKPNLNQPRKAFDEDALMELTNSIRIHGVISPIIVVKQGEEYMIIAGERRYRASKHAGLLTIPAIIRNYSDKQIKEISLIENIQREDLNPIETAQAIKQLMFDYSYTQDAVAERIGKSRPAVANLLRLLVLSPAVIELVENGSLSAGHAKCFVVIENSADQLALAQRCIKEKLSVRECEKMVKDFLNPKPAKRPLSQSVELKDLVQRMQRSFSTKVRLLGNDNKGMITIEYYNRDDLDRISDIVGIIEDTKEKFDD